MNIFNISKTNNFIFCAQNIDIRRQNKMITESAQMLSTCFNVFMHNENDDPDRVNVFKTTHLNHPCSVWVRESKLNFNWLLAYALNLCYLYEQRTGKEHKTKRVLVVLWEESKHNLQFNMRFDNDDTLTPFPCCIDRDLYPSCYEFDDTYLRYRHYMNLKWEQDTRKNITPKFDFGIYPTFIKPEVKQMIENSMIKIEYA